MDHSDASGSSTFFLFLYLFFLMKDYGSIVIFPTFIVYFVSLVLSASPFSSKLVSVVMFDAVMLFLICILICLVTFFSKMNKLTRERTH